MDQDQHIWRVWAGFLQHWGVEKWVAATLETLGPLSILGAQAVHLSQPLLSKTVPDDHLDALARLLEDPIQTRAFVTYLREASSL
jgi:hypothetical protein